MDKIEVPKNIFNLLNQLKENNNREWYQENKPLFKELEEGFKAFGEALGAKLEEKDELSRMKVYRLYRDVRFSKDKTPFNVHRSISFFRAGMGEYYLHLKPNDCYLIVGYWDIQPDELKRLRQEFEFDASEMRQILSSKGFKKHFNGLETRELKTAPRGFDKQHENIDLIRKKSLLVKKEFSDLEVLSPDFMNKLLIPFYAARPFLNYIDNVLGVDENGVPLGN